MLHRCSESGGITRTVRHKQTVIGVFNESREVIIPGNDENLDAASEQAAKLVELETNVQAQHPHGTARGVLQGDIFGRGEELGFANRDCV
jgi:hypothetical protein